jgi:hypothetical protein
MRFYTPETWLYFMLSMTPLTSYYLLNELFFPTVPNAKSLQSLKIGGSDDAGGFVFTLWQYVITEACFSSPVVVKLPASSSRLLYILSYWQEG